MAILRDILIGYIAISLFAFLIGLFNGLNWGSHNLICRDYEERSYIRSALPAHELGCFLGKPRLRDKQ